MRLNGLFLAGSVFLLAFDGSPRAECLLDQQPQVRISVTADAPGNDNENLNGEFVTIENLGSDLLDIGRWRLCDAASHCFTFPSTAAVPSNESIRIYTGSGQNDGESFYMGSRRAVWNNDRDVATLSDDGGNVVLVFTYPAGPTSSTAPAATKQKACCRICRTGKACGNSCISSTKTCRAGPGCACNG
jgi:hypothetical protein